MDQKEDGQQKNGGLPGCLSCIQVVEELDAQKHDPDQFGCADEHPGFNVNREPAQDVEFLVGKGEKAIIRAPHGLIDEAPSRCKVVEKISLGEQPTRSL